MFKLSSTVSKVILSSVALVLIMFCVVDVSNHIINFYNDPLKIKILLTIIFSAITFILITTTYKITKSTNDKQTKIKFSQIFDFLGEEISIPDSKTLTFTYLNKSLLNNTQYEPNELIGREITNTNPDCEITKMKEFIQPLITKELDVLKYETVRARKDGSKYPIQTMLKYFDDTNTLIAFSQDLTKEKEIDAIKAQFVSIINHEIRTPLTSLSGALKIISTDLVGEIPPTMKEMINVANNNATRLLEIINDLLEADKLEAQAQKLDFTNQDSNKV